MKEVFPETHSLTGLITHGQFNAFNEWRNPQHRTFKDDHLDPAAGDYELNQRDKPKSRIEVQQYKEKLIWIRDLHEKTDHQQ